MSYNAEHGEWKFDVEHFSRYGLLDVDSDGEDMAAAGSGELGATAAGELQPAGEDLGGDDMLEGRQSAGLSA